MMNQQYLADLKSAISQAVHQCNNHLSIILSNCEMALATDDHEMAKKKIESCVSRVTYLTDLLSQLNRFATVNTEIRPASLRTLFEESLKQIEARANAQQIECRTHVVADGLFPVPAQVIQLMMDLLGANALFAATTGAEKKMAVEVLQMAGEVSILVANSGKSPLSTIDKAVFNYYFPNRTEPAYDSLASVKTLTALLGGQVQFRRNNGMNEIYIKLPLRTF